MAQFDVQSLYVPNQMGPIGPYVGACCPLTGTGNPNGTVIGNQGQLYVDTSNGNVWAQTRDNSLTGWVLQAGGGGGGTQQVYTYTGASPAGTALPFPTNPAIPNICYDGNFAGGPTLEWNVNSQLWS